MNTSGGTAESGCRPIQRGAGSERLCPVWAAPASPRSDVGEGEQTLHTDTEDTPVTNLPDAMLQGQH